MFRVKDSPSITCILRLREKKIKDETKNQLPVLSVVSGANNVLFHTAKKHPHLLFQHISDYWTTHLLQIPVVYSQKEINIIQVKRASGLHGGVNEIGGTQCNEGVRIKYRR